MSEVITFRIILITLLAIAAGLIVYIAFQVYEERCQRRRLKNRRPSTRPRSVDISLDEFEQKISNQ